jgi:hypothetical protein
MNWLGILLWAFVIVLLILCIFQSWINTHR